MDAHGGPQGGERSVTLTEQGHDSGGGDLVFRGLTTDPCLSRHSSSASAITASSNDPNVALTKSRMVFLWVGGGEMAIRRHGVKVGTSVLAGRLDQSARSGTTD